MTRATATTATSRRRRVNRRCQACVFSPSMASNTRQHIRMCFVTGTSARLRHSLPSYDDHGVDAGLGLGEGDDVLAAAADEHGLEKPPPGGGPPAGGPPCAPAPPAPGGG